MKYSKLIAPVIITILLVLFLGGYAMLWTFIPGLPAMLKVLLLFIFMGLIGVSLYNLYERFQEIRSGEEDDLSKY